MAELKYWLWLAGRRGIPKAKLVELLDYFGSPEEIYFAGEPYYRHVLEGDVSSLLDKNTAEARDILRRCDDMGCSIVTIHDSGYPARLSNIYDPPLVLYVKGRLPDLDSEAAVAIVGTRNCTPYGIITAERISFEAARCGGVIVSGLARGVDAAAVKGALRAGGRVVGVLGCGLDIVYPRENASLFEDVAATGAIISEFAPGTPPEGKNFPVRNRIMSGLSVGVTLIEAPERSGALITASLALEQGRDVFVVPGNIDAYSCKGSNRLLREGAIPVMCGWDIMCQYEHLFPDRVKSPDGRDMPPLESDAAQALLAKEMPAPAGRNPKMPEKESASGPKATKKVIDNESAPVYIDIIVDPDSLTLDERAVLGAMDARRHMDEIIVATGLPAKAVMSALTTLEIQGCVTQEPGKYFVPHFKFDK